MAQVTKGIRSILSLPGAYDLLMRSLGADRSRRVVVDEYLRPRLGDRILDIGCGTAAIVDFLPKDIEYFGVDLSADYIASATQHYGDRAHFRVGDVNELDFGSQERFDIITAWGLLHHLEDDEVSRLATTARKLLGADGRFITLDNCFTSDQSPVARTVIRWDRGRNVRTPAEYQALISEVFDEVACDVRHDLLRVPYTHVIIEAVVRSC